MDTRSEQGRRTIRIAVANDYELVVRGVSALLEDDDRIDVVALEAGHHVDVDVDVVLFDSFGSTVALGPKVEEILANPKVDRVLVYSSWFERAAVERVLESGAAGFVAKSVDGEELADAIVRAHRGERVVVGVDGVASADDVPPADGRTWPGAAHGLTEREANVLALIVGGLENTEIAERLFISVNTVKTRIRGLYRKIGVDTRVQAALWGVKHGFDPDNVVIWLE